MIVSTYEVYCQAVQIYTYARIVTKLAVFATAYYYK